MKHKHIFGYLIVKLACTCIIVSHGNLQHKSSKYAIIVNSYTCLICRPESGFNYKLSSYTTKVLILRSKCMWNELTAIKTQIV